jgi:hypothetical protein
MNECTGHEQSRILLKELTRVKISSVKFYGDLPCQSSLIKIESCDSYNISRLWSKPSQFPERGKGNKEIWELREML